MVPYVPQWVKYLVKGNNYIIFMNVHGSVCAPVGEVSGQG